MRFTTVLATSFAATAAASSVGSSEDFHEWAVSLQKEYASDPSSDEYRERKANFAANLRNAAEQRRNEKGTATYGPNVYFDMSEEEFRPRRDGFKPVHHDAFAKACLANVGPSSLSSDDTTLPEDFDWRDHTPTAVTPVKNQGQCGSCWAFSSIGAIETAWSLKYNKPVVSMSEQSVVDCSHGCSKDPMDPNTPDCNSGCAGGWQWTAYNDIASPTAPVWSGVPTEQNYPYTGTTDMCDSHKIKPGFGAQVTNYTCLTTYGSKTGADEDVMKAYLHEHGPLSFAMNATPLMSYNGGILNPQSCDPANLDHAMLIVGYGVSAQSEKYWIIKNSWGKYWGESGYFKINRGAGTCGLNMAVSHPTVA
jgi:cathepsin F